MLPAVTAPLLLLDHPPSLLLLLLSGGEAPRVAFTSASIPASGVPSISRRPRPCSSPLWGTSSSWSLLRARGPLPLSKAGVEGARGGGAALLQLLQLRGRSRREGDVRLMIWRGGKRNMCVRVFVWSTWGGSG